MYDQITCQSALYTYNEQRKINVQYDDFWKRKKSLQHLLNHRLYTTIQSCNRSFFFLSCVQLQLTFGFELAVQSHHAGFARFICFNRWSPFSDITSTVCLWYDEKMESISLAQGHQSRNESQPLEEEI